MPTPLISEFEPLKKQYELIYDIRKTFDYELGVHHILLSGAIGSAKSSAAAHIIVTHCMKYKDARVGIGRLSMPALKGTLLRAILEHIGDTIPVKHNGVTGIITFPNGSEIRAFSWSDKKYMKVRSFEFTAFVFEELTENMTDDIYTEVEGRVGRLTHVDEKWILNCTNPDDPSHWVHKRFIGEPKDNHHVYYSRTTDNTYLPETYVKSLRENFDPKMARRMLDGEWLSISQDVIYYEYRKEEHMINTTYTLKTHHPIWLSFDFNIGEGKPMSCCLGQYIDGELHVFDEVVIAGARTEDIMIELYSRGYFELDVDWILTGDASGSARDTRGTKSDYDIIKKYIANVTSSRGPVRFEMKVPRSNPPVRQRHNRVNSYLKNDLGKIRMFIYKACKTVDEALRLTKLKKGGSYIEDDSNSYQHVGTALGYMLDRAHREANKTHGGVYDRNY